MADRRNHQRLEGQDRRSFPRPPLWLNLLLLLLGIGGVLYGRYHREQVASEFAEVIKRQQRTPNDTRKLKEELAEMGLTRDALQKELQARAQFAQSLKSENFYLSIDTKARKLRFYYGDTVLREGEVQIGEGRTVETNDKSWTFAPLRGAFAVDGKVVGLNWEVPEWVYPMHGQPVPDSPAVVPNGLGKYVIILPNGYVIHSPPSAESPLQGPKPGSFMVSEDDLRAIWPRIHKGKTQVFIF